MYLCIIFMFSVLGDMFWTCYTSILMSTFFKDLSWFFQCPLCSVSCVLSKSEPRRGGQCGTMPAMLAARDFESGLRVIQGSGRPSRIMTQPISLGPCFVQ